MVLKDFLSHGSSCLDRAESGTNYKLWKWQCASWHHPLFSVFLPHLLLCLVEAIAAMRAFSVWISFPLLQCNTWDRLCMKKIQIYLSPGSRDSSSRFDGQIYLGIWWGWHIMAEVSAHNWSLKARREWREETGVLVSPQRCTPMT
jgi:hypothetical protein